MIRCSSVTCVNGAPVMAKLYRERANRKPNETRYITWVRYTDTPGGEWIASKAEILAINQFIEELRG